MSKREIIENLWFSIIYYSDTTFDCGMVGNSGEFHTDKEERECKAARDKAMTDLIEKFAAATGWKPIPNKEDWNFEKQQRNGTK